MSTGRARVDRYHLCVPRISLSLALLALVLGSCAAPAASPRPTVEAAASGAPQGTASASPVAGPATPSAEPTPGPVAAPPSIILDQRPIPIMTGALVAATIGADIERTVRAGVEGYLWSLDRYRADGSMFPLQGRFAEVVAAGLTASSTDGVKRKFSIGSMRVDRYLSKPWGVPALADVSVTIIDKAVEGSAPEQRETGRLRLLGNPLRVTDGWDTANGRWFNGPTTMTEAEIRTAIPQPLSFFLTHESWLPGQPVETRFSSIDSPFMRSREAYVSSFDRTKIVSRMFEDVTARIERFETFAEISHGLATVLLRGTVSKADAAGRTTREPFERRVLVLYGNWAPEIVDEEIAAGVWRSGGDLALKDIDLNRA